MQIILATAAGLAVLTGIVHSVMGELLIFRHLRNGTLVPTHDAPPLKNRNIRIVWATWHLATVFGWAFAAVLGRLAMDPQAEIISLVVGATVAAYAGGAMLVLVGTRGRHPGWVALSAVAALTWSALGGA
ncbi:MAG: hypothetical protein ABW104_15370 [Candidatus Thiodiazotropha sp. 6PLUC2]